MDRNSRFETVSLVLVTALTLSVTFSGCARDGSRGPFGQLLNPPPGAISSAEDQGIESTQSRTVQQTTWEDPVAEQEWLTSLPEAVAQAQSNDKLILVDFTGSDWCHWCVKLKEEVFESPEFKSWANQNVVLLEIDSPKRSTLPLATREQNEMLKSRYNVSSFPTVLLVDAEGNVKARMGYEKGKSPTQWVQLAESRLQQNTNVTRVADGQAPSDSMIR